MIMDTDLQFCNATSVAASAGTTLIGSQIDTGVAGTLELDDLYLVILVTTAIVAAGAGTISFALASDTTAAVSTTATNIPFVTQNFITSTSGTLIPAGTVLAVVPLPRSAGTYLPAKRFLGILLTIATQTVSAGAVSIFLTPEGGRWAANPTVAN